MSSWLSLDVLFKLSSVYILLPFFTFLLHHTQTNAFKNVHAFSLDLCLVCHSNVHYVKHSVSQLQPCCVSADVKRIELVNSLKGNSFKKVQYVVVVLLLKQLVHFKWNLSVVKPCFNFTYPSLMMILHDLGLLSPCPDCSDKTSRYTGISVVLVFLVSVLQEDFTHKWKCCLGFIWTINFWFHLIWLLVKWIHNFFIKIFQIVGLSTFSSHGY